MNLRFKQCRVCRKNENCEFRNDLRTAVREIGDGVTAVINCKPYWETWKAGDRVQFDVSDRIQKHEDNGYPSGYEWVRNIASPVTGTITGEAGSNYTFEILLDQPFTQTREDLHSTEERTNYYKQSAKIWPLGAQFPKRVQ